MWDNKKSLFLLKRQQNSNYQWISGHITAPHENRYCNTPSLRGINGMSLCSLHNHHSLLCRGGSSLEVGLSPRLTTSRSWWRFTFIRNRKGALAVNQTHGLVFTSTHLNLSRRCGCSIHNPVRSVPFYKKRDKTIRQILSQLTMPGRDCFKILLCESITVLSELLPAWSISSGLSASWSRMCTASDSFDRWRQYSSGSTPWRHGSA